MRIRSIKPEFWRSTDISGLAIEDRLLFIGIWSYVDDNGVGFDKLSAITADLFADDLEEDPQGTFARVSRGLANLSASGRILRYTVENTKYLSVVNWSKHQRIDRPGKARHPQYSGDPDAIRESVASLPVNVSPGAVDQGTGEQGIRGTEDQNKDLRTGSAVERVIEAEVIEDEPKSSAEANRFEEFWDAYPRKVGKQKCIAKYKAARNRATQQEIIDGAHRLANDPNLPEQTYVPHPTTWLERNGWQDEPLPMRFRTSSDERMAVGMELASRAASRPKMINPFE